MNSFLLASLLVIGDSLSSPTGCEWPRHLQDQFAVTNLAQAALTLDSLDIPNHLKVKGTVVIWIGTNDAGSGVPLITYKPKLRETIKRLKVRGAKEILVVGQPQLNVPRLNKFREATKYIADSENVGYLPMDWNSSVTIDGVHPTCEYNVTIANQILTSISPGKK